MSWSYAKAWNVSLNWLSSNDRFILIIFIYDLLSCTRAARCADAWEIFVKTSVLVRRRNFLERCFCGTYFPVFTSLVLWKWKRIFLESFLLFYSKNQLYFPQNWIMKCYDNTTYGLFSYNKKHNMLIFCQFELLKYLYLSKMIRMSHSCKFIITPSFPSITLHGAVKIL